MDTESDREAEAEFRPHLTKYLAATGQLRDNHLLMHYGVLHVAVAMDADAEHTVGFIPDSDWPYAYQLGALQYALTVHKGQIVRDGDEL